MDNQTLNCPARSYVKVTQDNMEESDNRLQQHT